MRRYLFLVLFLLLLVGCSSAKEDLGNSTYLSKVNVSVVEASEEKPLPFNVDEVLNEYDSLMRSNSQAIFNTEDPNIMLMGGNIEEVSNLLTALSRHVDNGEKLNKMEVEILDGVKMDQYFTNEFVVDEILIQVIAVDPSFISVCITSNE